MSTPSPAITSAINAQLNGETIIFLSTIYGEAAASSPVAWKSVAQVIMNRVGKREWKKYTTPLAVVMNTGFDAFTQKIAPYRKCYEYLRGKNDGSDARIEQLKAAVMPIYRRMEKDLTQGCILYYSPKAQAFLHQKNPNLYAEKPKWNFSVLKEVAIPGMLASDDFKFYKYA